MEKQRQRQQQGGGEGRTNHRGEQKKRKLSRKKLGGEQKTFHPGCWQAVESEQTKLCLGGDGGETGFEHGGGQQRAGLDTP